MCDSGPFARSIFKELEVREEKMGEGLMLSMLFGNLLFFNNIQ